jgi:hypothetical protein
MNRKTLAILLLIVGIVCAAAAIALGRPGLALAAFLVFGFSVSSLLSKAGRLADAISPLKGHRVHVSVWDNGIPGFAAGDCQLDSVASIGAGLHLFLRSDTGLRGDLKVAQPGPATVTEGSLEIQTARYVSWKGQRIHPPQDCHSPAVMIHRPDGR